ncbi:MAG: BREX-2 system phosphatase PglZ [Myxococcales bacterium]|nr:BREX-2 system phosphatase PglZ [Myxococcales bacterium]
MQERLLHKLVEAAGAKDRGYVLALATEGLQDLPPSFEVGQTTWAVVRPRSELDLRHKLWRAGSAPLVAILDREVAESPPYDLLRRAKGRRITALEVPEVLSTVLGIRVSGAEDERTQRLALTYLDALRSTVKGKTQPTVIDRRALDEMLLDVCVGASLRRESAGTLVARWMLEPPEWDGDVRWLVRDNLPRLLGPEGRLLGWALQHEMSLPTLLRSIVVHGLVLAIDDEEIPAALWGDELTQAKGSAEVEPESDYFFRRTVANLALDALDHLPPTRQREVLDEADTLGRRLLSTRVLAQSQVLPLGFHERAASLVARMDAGHGVATAELDRLRAHRVASTQEPRIALLERMARLSRWLVTSEPEDWGDVAEMVVRYQREDAFADMAAAELLRALASAEDWHVEATRLLDRWRERRNRQNLAFAEHFRGGYTKALHADGLVPLHRLWTEAVWQDRQADEAGVYVVILDGCSYPRFLSLIDALVSDDVGLEVAADGVAAGVAALAPLPTITSHARGAIFLGQIPHDGWMAELDWRESGERKTDPARFAQNRALGERSRKLFLKGDLADGGQALRAALADRSVNVIAAVFNAIDDQIGSSNIGAAVQVSPRDIVAFVPSLRQALDAGRRVLLTADHGHTPFVDKALRVGAGTSARWLSLEGGISVPDGFIAIDLGDLGGATAGPKAFAWRMGAYLGKPQVGFHGGCGLEEMVVPLAWLVRGGVEASLPAWWYGLSEADEDTQTEAQKHGERDAMSEEQTSTPSQPPSRKPRPKKHEPAPGQADMFDRGRTQQAYAAKVELPFSPEVLVALSDTDKATLGLLLDVGSATASEIAKVQQRKAARITGYMSSLGRKLARLGVSCFERDALPNGEAQYRWLEVQGVDPKRGGG